MICVCKRKCQVRNDDGKAVRFDPGDPPVDFKVCPKHFEPLEKVQENLDFGTAEETLLMAADFKLKDLKDYILKTYKEKTGNMGKEKLVAKLMDLRYRVAQVDKSALGELE